MFLDIYDSEFMQTALGITGHESTIRHRPGVSPQKKSEVQRKISHFKDSMNEGDAVTAAVRALVYVCAIKHMDERSFNQLRAMRSENAHMTLQQFKAMVREQYFRLLIDEPGALAAIPHLVGAATTRKNIAKAIRKIVLAAGVISEAQEQRLKHVDYLLS